MIVECTESIRDVESVMHRVKVSVEEFVDMKETVEEVLPGVDNEARELCVRRKQVNNSFSTYNPKIIGAVGMTHQYVHQTTCRPSWSSN